MAKRSAKSVRTVKAALQVPAAQRHRERTLAQAAAYGSLVGNVVAADQPDEAGNIGTPGTLNLWGFITGEDYNPDLDGYPMFGKYDQMRRGDAQVAASLLQVKLPLKAARQIIKPATDDPEDQAIADFVTETLIAEGAMKRPWTAVLDHMLLRFDFGCSAEEIVWAVGEAGEIKLQDLAPRLPRTFYRWIEYDSGPQRGDLQYLQQFAPKNGRYGFFNIPAERLVLHTHRKEGSNYYGISALRAAYPHYFYKSQLYRIDAIRHDRLGAGIFLARLTQDYKANAAPLDKIEETLRGLRSHEQAFAIQPYGVEYDLLVPKGGDTGNPGLIKSVEHHNVMIAAAFLQQFATQGQQRHGSFSQAKVTVDAFFDSLEGQANEISGEINIGIIRRLCDANFDMRGRQYPQHTFADIAGADADEICTNLSKLATARVITPDDDLEDYARDLLDAPAMSDELRGRDRTLIPKVTEQLTGQAPASAAAAAVPVEDGSQKTGPVNKGQVNTGVAREPFVEKGRRFGRVPTDHERRAFDLHGVPAHLDELQARLVRQLAATRRQQLKTVAAKVAQKDGRDTPAFTDIRHRHVSMPQTADLAKAIRGMQTRALEYGRQTVRDELQKQGIHAKDLAGPDNPTAAKNAKTALSALVSSAQITARKLSENWLARILDTALRLRRTGLQGPDLADRIESDLASEIESGAKRDAAGEVHEAFGIGRAQQVEFSKANIELCVYSAILDSNTCDNCAALDGEEFEVDSQEYFAALPPNQSCDGRDSCRCVMITVAKEHAA